jgi:hypothetical protein
MESNRGPDDSLKLRRSGTAVAGSHSHAAPMGLKTVLFGRWYFPQTGLPAGGFVVTMRSGRFGDYKHVAPTELAAQPPAATVPLAGLEVVRCQFGTLTVETASPAASTQRL